MADLSVVAPSPSPGIVRLVEDYLASCRARGLSPRTLANSYGYPLLDVFLPFCAREGITEPEQLSNRVLDRLGAELLEHGGKRGPLSKHSVHAYVRAVNQMIKWAKAEGETIDAKGQLPRLPKKLVNVLSREEMQAMEDAAGNERDKLIVRLLADTGIRVGGLVNLRVTDIVDHDRRPLLRVREKGGGGGSERLVPIPKLHRRLQRYIERGRKSDALSDRVFLGLRRGRSGEYEPLTESGVEQLIRTVAIQAEIKRPVYPHLLRHSYATWALSKGMNPIQLAQILGHSSLKMIQNVYAHLSPGDAYEATLRLFQAED